MQPTALRGNLRHHPPQPGQHAWLEIVGDWTLAHYAALRREVDQALPVTASERIELAGLGELDTAGAGLLLELLGPERVAELGTAQLPPERVALLRTVAAALDVAPDEAEPDTSAVADVLAHIGRTVAAVWCQQRELLGFIGLTLQTLPPARRGRRPGAGPTCCPPGAISIPSIPAWCRLRRRGCWGGNRRNCWSNAICRTTATGHGPWR